MMATALENNGAVVYIVSRRLDILEKAASDNNVGFSSQSLLKTPH